jgi:purine-binding chemotaxis protein CheW
MTGRAERAGVDWVALRAKVDQMRSVLESQSWLDDEAQAHLLRERARDLARPLGSETPDARRELVSFSIGDGDFALPTKSILELIRIRRIVPLPGASPSIHGLTAWRGSILLLLNLAELTGRSGASGSSQRLAVVVDGSEVPFGIPVDAVGDVLTISLEAIGELPESISVDRSLVQGVVSGTVLVIDQDALRNRVAQLK